MTNAALFEWLAGSAVYPGIATEAVRALPAASVGERWLDVGCGTGLVAVAAARRGYRVRAVDRDPGMVAAARRAVARGGLGHAVEVAIGSVATLATASADVVSAASLLVVLPDREAGAAALRAAVAPGGTLLIVEATETMSPAGAAATIAAQGNRRDRQVLRTWARARAGRALNPTHLNALADLEVRRIDILDGLVGVWSFREST